LYPRTQAGVAGRKGAKACAMLNGGKGIPTRLLLLRALG
jgi:hypothetical protein